MDYSIYDAIRAGFGKVVFIIRQEFAENFKEFLNRRLKDRIETRICIPGNECFTKGYTGSG